MNDEMKKAISEMIGNKLSVDFDTGDEETLRKLCASYMERIDFKPGDIVMWKEGMKNVKWPAYGKPAVVLGIADGQLDSTKESGSSCWMEPKNVRIGILDKLGDFEGWWVDGYRLCPFRG